MLRVVASALPLYAVEPRAGRGVARALYGILRLAVLLAVLIGAWARAAAVADKVSAIEITDRAATNLWR